MANHFISPVPAVPTPEPEVFEVKCRWMRNSPDEPWTLVTPAFITGGAVLPAIFLLTQFLTQLQASEFPKIEERLGDREKRVQILRASGIPLPDLSGRSR